MKKYIIPASVIANARESVEKANCARWLVDYDRKNPQYTSERKRTENLAILAAAEAAEAAALAPIAEAINSVEGNRVKARQLTAGQLIDTLIRVEKHLDIPKKDMVGIAINADIHAEKFSSRYKGIPESTQFRAVYTKSGWAVTEISRDRVRQSSESVRISLTDDSERALAKRAAVLRM